MLFKLLLLLVVVPLIELVLLIQVDRVVGLSWTLALIVVTGAVGAALARAQGWRTYRQIQQELGQGRLPTDSLLDALMIFLAGALLLTPGILTDVLGFSLLTPPCRRVYRGWLARWFKSRFKLQGFDRPGATGPGAPPQRDQIIDSYVVEKKDDKSDD